MYSIYYLTSEIDNYVPMYIGMTKVGLQKRLKEHKHNRPKSFNRRYIWILSRDKNIVIRELVTNISTFKECSSMELFWINFWKNINPDLKNSITYELSEHPYKNSLENIKRNISEGVINKKCRSILVFNKNNIFIEEFRTIKQASKYLSLKEEIITKNLRDETKSYNYIFIYKDEYDETKDYSYKIYNAKLRKRPINKPIVSKNCRDKVSKKVKLLDIETNQILDFNTQQKACDCLGFSSASISRAKKTNSLILKKYKIL